MPGYQADFYPAIFHQMRVCGHPGGKAFSPPAKRSGLHPSSPLSNQKLRSAPPHPDSCFPAMPGTQLCLAGEQEILQLNFFFNLLR
jgi:hypothetical protein